MKGKAEPLALRFQRASAALERARSRPADPDALAAAQAAFWPLYAEYSGGVTPDPTAPDPRPGYLPGHHVTARFMTPRVGWALGVAVLLALALAQVMR